MSKPKVKGPRAPRERSATVRQELLGLLRETPLTSLELSQLAGLSERDVLPHLEHLSRSLRRGPERLVMRPPVCKQCDYVFEDRSRVTRPGRCPACKAQRVSLPVFEVVPAADEG